MPKKVTVDDFLALSSDIRTDEYEEKIDADEEEYEGEEDEVNVVTQLTKVASVDNLPAPSNMSQQRAPSLRRLTKGVKDGALYIIKEMRVDQFSVARNRVELTPSMCQRRGCNYDGAESFRGFGNIRRDVDRQAAIERLNQHVEDVHNQSEDLIVRGDQLPKRWLGVKSQTL